MAETKRVRNRKGAVLVEMTSIQRTWLIAQAGSRGLTMADTIRQLIREGFLREKRRLEKSCHNSDNGLDHD